MNGLLELVADAYQRNIGNPARQLVGNGVRGLLGLDPGDYADGLGMEAYRNAQALSMAPTPLAFAALPAAVVKGVKGVKSGAKAGKIGEFSEELNASKRSSLLDPQPTAQRPFNADYPKTAGVDDAGRLTTDIEGRPLLARYVAGRRVGDGVDESIARGDANRIADALGIQRFAAARTGPDLKSDVGRFWTGRDARTGLPIPGKQPRIFVDQAQPAEMGARVFEHELGHALEDFTTRNAIPTSGVVKELRTAYEQLNTPGSYKPGRGASPEAFGYKGADVERELWAEAFRGYMRDPNWMKTIAPSAAKRIREYVNANPNLNKVIQFNTLAPAGMAGVLGAGLLATDEQN